MFSFHQLSKTNTVSASWNDAQCRHHSKEGYYGFNLSPFNLGRKCQNRAFILFPVYFESWYVSIYHELFKNTLQTNMYLWTLSINLRFSIFFVFMLRNPHLLKWSKRCKYWSTNPWTKSSFLNCSNNSKICNKINKYSWNLIGLRVRRTYWFKIPDFHLLRLV